MAEGPAQILRFEEDCDIALEEDEALVWGSIVNAAFVRHLGIPFLPIGAGLDDHVFEPNDTPGSVFLADRVTLSIENSISDIRVREELVDFVELGSRVSLRVPYVNLKTGKDDLALLALARQRVDL
jgi:hypothetical protein